MFIGLFELIIIIIADIFMQQLNNMSFKIGQIKFSVFFIKIIFTFNFQSQSQSLAFDFSREKQNLKENGNKIFRKTFQ